MFIKLVLIFIMASSATAMHVPRYADLDEDDQLLFKAAYDAPTYEHEEYHEDEVIPLNKLDLLKDGMWVVKAKLKEIKTFNKALAANMLATKIQLKQFLANHEKSIKKHHHVEIEKKKPVYNYQIPSPQPPSYAQYEHPHYSPPVHQYEKPQHYATPVHNYELPQYSAPVPQYEPAQHQTPPNQYEPTHNTMPQYGPPQYALPQYGAPQYNYDPYFVQ